MSQRPVVFLVDMNAFFISCETTRRPELVGQCAAVAGDPKNRTGIILAANYPARAKGVRTAMTVSQGLRLCPEMILVPPDHKFYGQTSQRVMALLGRYTPVVEQNSIDEAWLDMTGTEKLFGPPEETATRIMEEISQELNLMCSIGIAENKFLAKMAAEMKKPLGITTLWPYELPKKLWTLPAGAMYGVGKKTAEKLNNIGLYSIGDLAHAPAEILSSTLGKYGPQLKTQALGESQDKVISHLADEMKSIGRSQTLSQDAHSPQEIRLLLMALCESVAYRARRHEKKGRTVQITLKHSDFSSITRQSQCQGSTCYTDDIFSIAWTLMQKNWPKSLGIRLIGVSLTDFDEGSLDSSTFFHDSSHKKSSTKDAPNQQLSFEDLFSSSLTSSPPSAFKDPEPLSAKENPASNSEKLLQEKKRKLEETLDQVREKYGRQAVQRAALLDGKSEK